LKDEAKDVRGSLFFYSFRFAIRFFFYFGTGVDEPINAVGGFAKILTAKSHWGREYSQHFDFVAE
jgi:hypothetical protein